MSRFLIKVFLSVFRSRVNILASFLLIIFTISSSGEKLTEFQIPFEMVHLAIDESQIYIADSYSCIIYIFSKENYNLVGQFGRKGQGPAEFEYIVSMRVYPKYIFVCSGRKVSYFSKKGDFIKSISPPLPSTGGYIPLGSNFVGKKYLPEDPKKDKHRIAIELYNSKFKKIKTIYLAELNKLTKYNSRNGKRDILVVNDCFKLDVYKDKLYIGDSTKGFRFFIFDVKGKMLREIDLPYKRRSISSRDKNKILARFRRELGEQEIKRRMNLYNQIFPKFYPAYTDFIVSAERIFSFSYPVPDIPRELCVIDLEGTLISKSSMPRTNIIFSPSDNNFIYGNNLYSMHYNHETMNWELHIDIRNLATKTE